MNTDAQTTVKLTADQVRERLIQLAERAFKSAVDEAELNLLVSVTTGKADTFTVSGNIWEAIIRHHNHAPYPFEETDDDGPLEQYRGEAWQVFHRLAALAAGEEVNDTLEMWPDTDDTLFNYELFSALIARGGEIVNYACGLPGYLADSEKVVKALGDEGSQTVRGYFASLWHYHPADLGVALVERGFGKSVRTLRSLSVALLNAVDAYDKAEETAERYNQLGVIGLIHPLLKGVVFESIRESYSAVVGIAEGDGTVELVEKALRDSLAVGNSNKNDLPSFRDAQDEDASTALNTPTEQLLASFRAHVANELSLRRGPWVD